MKIENRDGWYALFISITQNISPAQALAGMEGKRKGLRSLSWEEFVRVYREGEEKLREDSRKYRNTESNRAYQRNTAGFIRQPLSRSCAETNTSESTVRPRGIGSALHPRAKGSE